MMSAILSVTTSFDLDDYRIRLIVLGDGDEVESVLQYDRDISEVHSVALTFSDGEKKVIPVRPFGGPASEKGAVK
jgi:hypothetical protein